MKSLFERKNAVLGLYDLRRLQVSKKRYMDIEILITDPEVTKLAAFSKVTAWHNKFATRKKIV